MSTYDRSVGLRHQTDTWAAPEEIPPLTLMAETKIRSGLVISLD